MWKKNILLLTFSIMTSLCSQASQLKPPMVFKYYSNNEFIPLDIDPEYLSDLSEAINKVEGGMLVGEAILDTARKYIESEKVFKLDDETFKLLNAKKEVCHEINGESKCHEKLALYSPIHDAIFLKDSTVDFSILTHEVIHGMQYQGRWMHDLVAGYRLIEKKKIRISPSEFKDYLSFYYERQAHYYTQRIYPSKEWLDKAHEFKPSAQGVSLLLAKSGFSLISYGTAGPAIMNSKVSYPDRMGNAILNNGEGAAFTDRGYSAFKLQELMYVDRPQAAVALTSNMDFFWHVNANKSVNQTYNGKRNLFHKKLFKKLDTNFYNGISANYEYYKAIVEQSPSETPFEIWFSGLENVNRFINEDIDQKSYEFITENYFEALLGNEGADPTLRVTPSFLQCQIKVIPLK